MEWWSFGMMELKRSLSHLSLAISHSWSFVVIRSHLWMTSKEISFEINFVGVDKNL